MVKVSELEKLEIFKIFTIDQLAELAEITEKMPYSKSEIIYHRGDRAINLFVVVRGKVSLRLLEPGDSVGIAFEERRRGEMFGVATFMTPQEYTLTALCLEDTEVLAIDAEDLHSLCERRQDVGYRLMKIVAQVYLDRYKLAKIELYRMVHSAPIVTP